MHRTAIVTGANRGIGLEIAKQLAGKGLRVVACARDRGEAEQAARTIASLGGDATGVALDVAAAASVAAFADSFEGVDVLVNNAGINIDGGQTPSAADMDSIRRTFDVNFFGAWRMTMVVVPFMRRRGYGRIVNVSSGVGAITEGVNAMWPAYRTSKTALNSLTRTLAEELRGTNILVNAACTGWVRTVLGGDAAPRSPSEGADTPVWLATLPDGGPTGGFFRDRRPAAW